MKYILNNSKIFFDEMYNVQNVQWRLRDKVVRALV